MNETAINGWSYDVLGFQIKSDLYSRQVLSDKPNNFKTTLIKPQSELAINMMKDPYILNLISLKENYIETELEIAMVETVTRTVNASTVSLEYFDKIIEISKI